MSSVELVTPALAARAWIVDELGDAGIEATADAGAFHPQPVGVLVGLPALVERGLASSTFEVPVWIVSGDPLNAELALGRLYVLADQAADALGQAAYRPSSYRSPLNVEPLPALELTVTVTVRR
jgi:hypothetical protein